MAVRLCTIVTCTPAAWSEGVEGARADTPLSGPPTPPPSAPDVAPLERARAMCTLLGLSKGGEKGVQFKALAAAKAAIRTGDAFLENAYADGIESYM